MKLLHSDTAFIDRMFPNMPHHVVCISNEVVANFPKGARTRVVLRINGQGDIQCGLNTHSTKRLKKVDLQVERALEFFAAEQEKQRFKGRK